MYSVLSFKLLEAALIAQALLSPPVSHGPRTLVHEAVSHCLFAACISNQAGNVVAPETTAQQLLLPAEAQVWWKGNKEGLGRVREERLGERMEGSSR
eukprot:1161645-Pelagomonas_calceolata.AAC.23